MLRRLVLLFLLSHRYFLTTQAYQYDTPRFLRDRNDKCGNGRCERQLDETCVNCPQDCGDCAGSDPLNRECIAESPNARFPCSKDDDCGGRCDGQSDVPASPCLEDDDCPPNDGFWREQGKCITFGTCRRISLICVPTSPNAGSTCQGDRDCGGRCSIVSVDPDAPCQLDDDCPSSNGRTNLGNCISFGNCRATFTDILPVPTPTTTAEPTPQPTPQPTNAPTFMPTAAPTEGPTKTPTGSPTAAPVPPTPAPTASVVYGLQPSCRINDDSRYNICLDFKSSSGVYEPWMEAFEAARIQWESVIVGNLEERSTERLSDQWCTEFPAVIDDHYICGREEDIDGPGRILGSATWRRGRNLGPGATTPWVGLMEFDTSDIPQLMESGRWNDLVRREMARVIGFGTIWTFNDLYTVGSGVYNSGTNADREWRKICSAPLPVELDGGEGTIDENWDEQCLRDELMTGAFNEATRLYLSSVTIASLQDIGYEVDYGQADEFGLEQLGNCVIKGTDYCPEKTSSGTRRARHTKRALSSQGQEAVMSYAQELLESMQTADTSSERTNDDDVINDSTVTVIYQDDNGQIFSVTVTSGDARNIN